MLRAAIAFLILAIIAAVLGFSGLAGTASSIAQILFVFFLVLFFVGLMVDRRRAPGRATRVAPALERAMPGAIVRQPLTAAEVTTPNPRMKGF